MYLVSRAHQLWQCIPLKLVFCRHITSSHPIPCPSPSPSQVVDDNAVNRKVLAAQLRRFSILVEEACNGEEAVNKVMTAAAAATAGAGTAGGAVKSSNGSSIASRGMRGQPVSEAAVWSESASTDSGRFACVFMDLEVREPCRMKHRPSLLEWWTIERKNELSCRGSARGVFRACMMVTYVEFAASTVRVSIHLSA